MNNKKIYVVNIGITGIAYNFSTKAKANRWIKEILYKEYLQTETSYRNKMPLKKFIERELLRGNDILTLEQFIKDHDIHIDSEMLDPDL